MNTLPEINTEKIRKDLMEFDNIFKAVCYKIKDYHYPFLKNARSGRGGCVEIDYSDWSDEGIAITISVPPACGCCPNDEYFYTIPTDVITEEGLQRYFDKCEEKKRQEKIKKQKEEEKNEQEKIAKEKELLKKLSNKYPNG